jgi:hypothetical protein
MILVVGTHELEQILQQQHVTRYPLNGQNEQRIEMQVGVALATLQPRDIFGVRLEFNRLFDRIVIVVDV